MVVWINLFTTKGIWKNIWAYYYLAKHIYLTGSLENKIVKNVDKEIRYFNYSIVLIDSLCKLLYIYYYRHDLEKVYYYKSLIEKHNMFNDEYKKIIENVLDKIKTKKFGYYFLVFSLSII